MYKYDIAKRRKDRNCYGICWNQYKKHNNLTRRAREKRVWQREVEIYF